MCDSYFDVALVDGMGGMVIRIHFEQPKIQQNQFQIFSGNLNPLESNVELFIDDDS
jgi:hypothetical protein